jgi:hypothetical protein
MRIARWIIGSGVVWVLSACIIPIYMDEGSRFGGTTAAFSKTIPFAPGGAISVDNGLGDIVIRGWDRDELEVTAEETWADPSGREVSIRRRFFGSFGENQGPAEGSGFGRRSGRSAGDSGPS